MNGLDRTASSLFEALYSESPDLGLISQKAGAGQSLDFSLFPVRDSSTAEGVKLVDDSIQRIKGTLKDLETKVGAAVTIDDLNERLMEVTVLLMNVRDEMDKNRSQNEEELLEVSNKLDSQDVKIEQLNRSVNSIIDENKQLSSQLDSSNKELRSVRNSWSWKITRPLRFLASLFR